MKTIPIRTFTPEILSLWNAQKARPHCIGIVVRRQFHHEIFSKAQNGGDKKICVNLRSHSVWLGGGMDIRRGLWQRKRNQQLDVSKIAIHEPKK